MRAPILGMFPVTVLSHVPPGDSFGEVHVQRPHFRDKKPPRFGGVRIASRDYHERISLNSFLHCDYQKICSPKPASIALMSPSSELEELSIFKRTVSMLE